MGDLRGVIRDESFSILDVLVVIFLILIILIIIRVKNHYKKELTENGFRGYL
jgi:hypothetical protein